MFLLMLIKVYLCMYFWAGCSHFLIYFNRVQRQRVNEFQRIRECCSMLVASQLDKPILAQY